MTESNIKGEAIRILLVESDSDHFELFIHRLYTNGVANQIHHVSDGEAALNFLFRREEFADVEKSPRPHLVLLAMDPPRIDATEVLSAIKANEELRNIPVVVLTTLPSTTGADDNQASGYLIKPVEFVDFRSMMRDLGFSWMVSNQHP